MGQIVLAVRMLFSNSLKTNNGTSLKANDSELANFTSQQ